MRIFYLNSDGTTKVPSRFIFCQKSNLLIFLHIILIYIGFSLVMILRQIILIYFILIHFNLIFFGINYYISRGKYIRQKSPLLRGKKNKINQGNFYHLTIPNKHYKIIMKGG